MQHAIDSAKARGERALIAFVTGGDPSVSQLRPILEALADGGADVIEVGLPFSDPIADGPTIQASSQRAIDSGVTVGEILDALSGFDRVAVVLMGYMNTLRRPGLASFATRAKEAGVAGVIVCDLAPDAEAGEWMGAARAQGLDTVFLTAPNSTDERLRLVCESSSGFVYAVSRTGVTGARHQPWAEARDLVARARKHTSLPVCVGFGVGSAEDVREVSEFADGVIVGSKIVDRLAADWNEGRGRDEFTSFVRRLKAATSLGHVG
ncbi:MAG: tryptophan synthase subunit alpha [Armatimonadetes bacterium]|nr:tryptophan synthase subunit alpha [Armatimonadota bacterium]